MNSSSTIYRSVRRVLTVAAVAVVALVAIFIGTGRAAYVVTHGISMHPSYHTGDLVVVARAASYHRGEIVAYHAAQAGHEVVLHRIIGGDAGGFIIKGDNNQSVDPTHPTASELIGRAVLHVPKVGAVLRSPLSRALVAVLILAVVGALMFSRRSKPVPAHATLPGSRQTRPLWMGLVGLDVAVLVALALSFLLAPRPPTPVAASTQTGIFSYHAAVPVSDTYPTGQIGTGDPVFVKLLDTLGVSYLYSTDAASPVRGTGRLDAALSTASGWHSVLPIVAPTPLVAGAIDMTGTLNLTRIQDLAVSVGKATGFNAGTVDVILTASVTVSVNGAAPVIYNSRLPLQLTTLELALSGEKPSSTPDGPAVVSTAALKTGVPIASPHAGDIPHQLRLGLLAVLVLAVGSTIVVWPPSAAEEKDATGRVVPRVRAVNLQPANTPRVQLADRLALEEVAASTGSPILEGDDGWAAAVTVAALYWVGTQRAPVARQPTPRPARAA